jgi:hypothetical protein
MTDRAVDLSAEAISLAIERALALSQTPRICPATVSSWSPPGPAIVSLDDGADDVETGADVLVAESGIVRAGQRVQVLLYPPYGAAIVGFIDGAYDPWHLFGAGGDGPVYAAGWEASPTVPFSPCEMRRVGDVVFLRGACWRASGASTVIATLPAGYRPSAFLAFPVASNSAFGQVNIGPEGVLDLYVGDPAFVSLSGISYPVDPLPAP